MKKRIHFPSRLTALFIFLFSLIISCGKVSPKGNIESKATKVQPFVNLHLEGKFRVFYLRGTEDVVEVETYENVANNLKISVNNKTLEIKEKRETKNVDFYNVTIYSRYNLEKISISDSVEMNTSSEIKTDNFRLQLRNHAKFIGSVNSRRAELDMSGTSRANFAGQTKDAFIKISDTAHLIAPYWLIKNLNIELKNGGYGEVNVKDSLKGSIKDSPNFLYYNDPVRAFTVDKTANVRNQKLE